MIGNHIYILNTNTREQDDVVLFNNLEIYIMQT